MDSSIKEVARELGYGSYKLVKVYTDGTIERYTTPYVPPSPEPDLVTGISSKDIIISQHPNISARLYLPKLTQPHQKFPILVYYHGGAFVVGSAFTSREHNFLYALVLKAQVLVVSVEYRMAPEYDVIATYENSWDALKWVIAHSPSSNNYDHLYAKDQWILGHADFHRLFIGGDSAGGNIVHNLAMRAGMDDLDGDIRIRGVYMGCPFFGSSKPINDESQENPKEPFLNFIKKMWEFVYPSSPNGLDDFWVNPEGPEAPSLELLGCQRLFVLAAEKDALSQRNVWYYKLVKKSGWHGEAELFVAEGEEHCFYARFLEKDSSKHCIDLIAAFLNK